MKKLVSPIHKMPDKEPTIHDYFDEFDILLMEGLDESAVEKFTSQVREFIQYGKSYRITIEEVEDPE